MNTHGSAQGAGLLGRTEDEGSARRMQVLLSGLESDAHSWNLIYIERLLAELGHEVVNLGPCVDSELLVDECLGRRPELVVLGTVNGHGLVDGRRAIQALRAEDELRDVPVVIGGRLTISGVVEPAKRDALLGAGFTAVLEEDIGAFRSFVTQLAAGAPS